MSLKEEILKLRDQGHSYNEIAKLLGCSKGTISFHCSESVRERTNLRRACHRKGIILESKFPSLPKTYSCTYCGKISEFKRSNRNKFCSMECRVKWRWENITKPNIESNSGIEDSKWLRKYLVEKFGDLCTECKVPSVWNGKPLTLHVDHINGNSDDNSTGNLRLLCPNCHTQTPTYGSRGIGNRYRKYSKRAINNRRYKGYTE